MAKFLVEVSYTAEGLKGLRKDKAAGRMAAVKAAAKSLGGKLDALYWALGDVDAYAIVDLPDTASATSMAMSVSATGLVRTKTIVLLTAEELDAALEKGGKYRAPGQ
jgi:uncharacterized protein with GYD domain